MSKINDLLIENARNSKNIKAIVSELEYQAERNETTVTVKGSHFQFNWSQDQLDQDAITDLQPDMEEAAVDNLRLEHPELF